MTLTQKEAMVALLRGKTITDGYWQYKMDGDRLLAKNPDKEWLQSLLLRSCGEVVWGLSFEEAVIQGTQEMKAWIREEREE